MRTAAWSVSSRPSWSIACAPTLHLVVRDYCAADPSANSTDSKNSDRIDLVNRIVEELAEMPSDELRDPKRVAEVLRLPGTLDDAHSGVEPRGYRVLYRLPRFSDAIIERIVGRFVNLQQIMRASLSELEQVEGVGEARARSVKDGLARLAEASIFERYQ